MTALFTVGETVLARIAAVGGATVELRLDDIEDDEEPRAAPPLIKGGPPWLVKPDEAVAEADQPAGPATTTPAPRAGAPAPSTSPQADPPQRVQRGDDKDRPRDGQAELQAVQDRARTLEARVLELDAKVQNQRTIMRRDKLRLQSLTRTARAGTGGDDGRQEGPPAFVDPAKQFDFEVYLEWARRIPAVDKERRPLAPYRVRDTFLASIDAVEGVERRKVVQVAVEVLTGLAEDLDSRELHPLRETASGGSSSVVRDGWMCWRVALKRKSPAAARMHFWRKGAEVEFSRVVTHDDMRP
jgi:hypothetical protein